MTYMVCLSGVMLNDPNDEFSDPSEALTRAQQLKRLYPEDVVSIVLVIDSP